MKELEEIPLNRSDENQINVNHIAENQADQNQAVANQIVENQTVVYFPTDGNYLIAYLFMALYYFIEYENGLVEYTCILLLNMN